MNSAGVHYHHKYVLSYSGDSGGSRGGQGTMPPKLRLSEEKLEYPTEQAYWRSGPGRITAQKQTLRWARERISRPKIFLGKGPRPHSQWGLGRGQPLMYSRHLWRLYSGAQLGSLQTQILDPALVASHAQEPGTKFTDHVSRFLCGNSHVHVSCTE